MEIKVAKINDKEIMHLSSASPRGGGGTPG